MSVEQIAEILLDQPFSRMTPPEHDVFLDASRDDERRGRLAHGRGQYLAPTGRIHRERPDRRRFCSWYPGLLERFSGHVFPDWKQHPLPAQPADRDVKLS